MMSDEEKVGETFICHSPTYRSDRPNTFVNKLDECLKTGHARHPRALGSPVTKDVPASAKAWMVKEHLTDPSEENATAEANQSDQDLFDTDGSGVDGSDCDN